MSASLLLRGWLIACLLHTSGASFAQETLTLSRQDGKTLPALAYRAASTPCLGIAIISHGAGGSEQGYRHLAEALAARGYLAVVPSHAESGREAVRTAVREHGGLREGLAAMIADGTRYQARFMDIDAARRWATPHCEGRQRLLVGHSMGAATVMLEAGARNPMGVRGTDAFDAYIALSPQGAGALFERDGWSDLRKPVLSITGTRDTELGTGSWESRTEPYRSMPPGCKWLAVIEGATHMALAGVGEARQVDAASTQVIGAFLESIARGDCRNVQTFPGLKLESK